MSSGATSDPGSPLADANTSAVSAFVPLSRRTQPQAHSPPQPPNVRRSTRRRSSLAADPPSSPSAPAPSTSFPTIFVAADAGAAPRPINIHLPLSLHDRAKLASLVKRHGGSVQRASNAADVVIFDLHEPNASRQTLRQCAASVPRVPCVTSDWITDSVEAAALCECGQPKYNPIQRLDEIEKRRTRAEARKVMPSNGTTAGSGAAAADGAAASSSSAVVPKFGRIPYTAADDKLIIEHLTLTRAPWSGFAVAKELEEISNGRHSATSFQTRLRDHLDRGKNYRAHAERLIREKRLAAAAAAAAGPSAASRADPATSAGRADSRRAESEGRTVTKDERTGPVLEFHARAPTSRAKAEAAAAREAEHDRREAMRRERAQVVTERETSSIPEEQTPAAEGSSSAQEPTAELREESTPTADDDAEQSRDSDAPGTDQTDGSFQEEANVREKTFTEEERRMILTRLASLLQQALQGGTVDDKGVLEIIEAPPARVETLKHIDVLYPPHSFFQRLADEPPRRHSPASWREHHAKNRQLYLDSARTYLSIMASQTETQTASGESGGSQKQAAAAASLQYKEPRDSPQADQFSGSDEPEAPHGEEADLSQQSVSQRARHHDAKVAMRRQSQEVEQERIAAVASPTPARVHVPSETPRDRSRARDNVEDAEFEDLPPLARATSASGIGKRRARQSEGAIGAEDGNVARPKGAKVLRRQTTDGVEAQGAQAGDEGVLRDSQTTNEADDDREAASEPPRRTRSETGLSPSPPPPNQSAARRRRIAPPGGSEDAAEVENGGGGLPSADALARRREAARARYEAQVRDFCATYGLRSVTKALPHLPPDGDVARGARRMEAKLRRLAAEHQLTRDAALEFVREARGDLDVAKRFMAVARRANVSGA